MVIIVVGCICGGICRLKHLLWLATMILIVVVVIAVVTFLPAKDNCSARVFVRPIMIAIVKNVTKN